MRANANGIELEYETFGVAGKPAILLIMGLGGQLLLWPEDFCRTLADAGYFVIRFDNRDIGLSTRFSGSGKANVPRAALHAALRMKVKSAYTLDDMAADAIGLLDALGIERAHLAGVSMGGMISQILAAKYPERVLSATLIMTTSGSRKLPQASWRLQLRLARGPKARDRESLIRYGMQSWRLIGSAGRYAAPEEELYKKVAATFDRAFHPAGVARQLTAILASGSRSWLLKDIHAPITVVHGSKDPLVPVPAAHDLARRIPQARLHIIEGMGHDLPNALLPILAEQILQTAGLARAA